MSKIGYPFTFHQSQTPPTVTDEEVEEVPIDTGLIRCICESTEDDGFTIQCDKCLTWQHAFCMNIKQDNIPDRYLCNDCVKLVASLNSQRSSKNNNNNTTQDMDTIGLIHTKPHSNNTIATKRKEDKNKSSHNSNKSLSVKSNSHNKRSRETAVQEDYRSPIHTKTTTSKKPKLSKRITMSKRSLQQQQQQQNNMDSDDEEIINNNNNDHTQNNNNNNNNNNNDNHHNDDTILHIYQKPIKHHHHHHNKKKEKHHHIDFNTISSKFVHEIMKDTIKRWSQSSKWKSQPWRDADQQDIAISSTSRKHHHQQHHHHPSNEPFIVMDTTSLQQSALNHISIHTLPKQQQSSSTYSQRSTSASSSFSSSSSSRLRKGVFADTQLNANAFLMEVHGEILLKTEYKFDVANDYAILGTACAHVLFYPTLDLCIDSRQLGNDARYFRRSCHPNAELRTMVFPSSSSNDATITATSTLMDHGDHHKSIRLGVFTRTTINEGEEITLGWNWQKGHISWRKNVEWYRSSSQLDTTTTQNRTFSHDTKEDLLHYKYDQHKIDEKLEIKSQYAMEQMMEKFDDEFGNCACGDRDVCLIEQLRQECFNHHHDKNSDMNLQVNGRLSDNLEFTSSLQQHQETGKTLQHSRQIIVTPSNNNNNNNSNLYKMGYEKTVTTVSSPAPGSVEDNIDIDVTSMSPITGSPVLTNPILAQVKKAATLDGDDELDIDSDIDIGEEIPNTNDTPMNKEKEKNEDGKKLSTGQASSPISSSSSGLSDLESANSGGVDDDHNGSSKKRKLMVRSELKEDNHGNIVLWKKSMVTSKKPSVLPFKKAWSKNFSQRDLKLDSNTTKTSTLIVSDIKIQEKPYINSSTTKLDTSSSSSSGSIPNQHSNNNNNSNNNVLMKDDPSPNNKTETDLDDGELSDASSASTIPLEEDDRNWSLRSSSHKLTTSGHNDYSETIASVHKNNNNSNNLESPSPSPSIITSVDTVNELQQHNNNDNNSNSNNNNNDIKNAVVDKDSKNYISDTKSISPNNINDPSKKQPESVPSSSSPSSSPPPPSAITTTNISTVKNESSFSSSSSSSSPSATHLEINDNKDVDQSKPTKVKVSLQEYLSRRLANQDPPSQ